MRTFPLATRFGEAAGAAKLGRGSGVAMIIGGFTVHGGRSAIVCDAAAMR
jgi:hypothetical protein